MSKRKEFLIKKGHTKKDGSLRHTFTTTFLLPILRLTKKDFGRSFLNAYIVTGNVLELYVVCINNEYDSTLTTGIVKSRINANFIDTEINDDEIIIKFTIPKEAYDIFNLFIEGKYSQFPEKYKKYLVGLYGMEVVPETRFVSEYNVLYPQDYKRKQIADELGVAKSAIKEVLDIPDLRYEEYKRLDDLIGEKIYDSEQRNS